MDIPLTLQPEKLWEPTFCPWKAEFSRVDLKFSKIILVLAYCFFRFLNYLFPISMTYSKHIQVLLWTYFPYLMYLFAFLPIGTLTLMAASLRLSGLARKTIFNRLLLLTSFLSHIWHQILLLSISELEKMNCSNSSRTLFSGFSLFHSFTPSNCPILSWGHLYLCQSQFMPANIH